MLSTVDMVVQRRDGPRRLREHDDNDDDKNSHWAEAVDLNLLPAGTIAADWQQWVCCCGPVLGQTDGRTLYRFIDPVPHTVRAASKTES